jgi:hypothetical protein
MTIANFDDSLKKTQQKFVKTVSMLAPKIKPRDGKRFHVKEYFDEKKWKKTKMPYSDTELEADEISDYRSRIEPNGKPLGDPDLLMEYDETKELSPVENLTTSGSEMSDELAVCSDSSFEENREEMLETPFTADGGGDLDPQQTQAMTDNPILNSLIQLLLQSFDFKQKSSYLRQSAAIMALASVVDVQLESYLSLTFRSIKDGIKQFFRDEYIAHQLERLTYKNGELLQELLGSLKARDAGQILATRIEIKGKLSCFVNIFSDTLGIESSHGGFTRIYEMLQSESLNQHLVFSLCDFTIRSIMEAVIVSHQ